MIAIDNTTIAKCLNFTFSDFDRNPKITNNKKIGATIGTYSVQPSTTPKSMLNKAVLLALISFRVANSRINMDNGKRI